MFNPLKSFNVLCLLTLSIFTTGCVVETKAIGKELSYPYKVMRVIDGDTVEIQLEGTWTRRNVRLACIDAPESDQPEGPSSKQYLEELLKDRLIYLDSKGSDRYDRLIAEVFIKVEDRMINVNKDMIQEGQAVVYSQYLDNCDQPNEYIQLEQEAQYENKGIWSSDTFVEPSKWRRSI